jgi:NADP-dependent 3-hydroxy acid dehydrogenase YdfG
VSGGHPLAGKVALITGASRGIGRALAVELGGLGANLVLAARSREELAVAAQEAGEGGVNQVVVQAADVSRRQEVERLAGAVRDSFGGLDILVNNAGLGRAGKLVDSDPDEVDLMIRVNLWGLYLVTRFCLPLMAGRGGGEVVNIASVAAVKYSPGFAMYSATKFGVKALSEALRNEVQDQGIRVLTVHPGMTASHFFEGFTPDGKPQVDTGGRPLLQPAEVARAIAQALTLPANAAVNELTIRPVWQER